MNNRDLLLMALRNLSRRKMRSILSIIGVIIGTTAIVVMLSLGLGLKEGNRRQIESYSNLHIVGVRNYGNNVNQVTGQPAKLDDAALKEIEQMDGVIAISPKTEQYMRIVCGKYVTDAEVVGIRSATMEKFGYQVMEGGRLLHSGDKNAVVFGYRTIYDFYNPKKTDYAEYIEPDENGKMPEPVIDIYTNKMFITGDQNYGNRRNGKREEGGLENEKITYKEYKVKGVGILKEKGRGQEDYSVFMDYDSLMKIKEEIQKSRGGRFFQTSNKENKYEEVVVYVEDINKVDQVLKETKKMGFDVDSAKDWLNQMQEQLALIQGVLGGIGAISLLVAAIGITNTMIMSIYERTREIGVMKVIGANLKDIRRLFLLEAALIGVVGGIAGVLFSYTVSFLLNTFLSKGFGDGMFMMGSGEGGPLSIIPFTLAVAAVIFSTAIGVLAGYYPANRAMKISALESLRNE